MRYRRGWERCATMRMRLLETSSRSDVRPDSVQVLGETLPHCGCPPVSLVWLSHGLRSRRAPREERLKRGLFCSK
jgi:hypothetical protein